MTIRKAFSHDRVPDGKEEWLTPRYIIDALGPFDLDPCSPINRPWDTARRHLTIQDDGLALPWSGTVWLNPPYGQSTIHWMKKMAEHNNGIALIFARTETATFHKYIWGRASALHWIKGRLRFYNADGTEADGTEADNSAGAPSVLVAYGTECGTRLWNCSKIPGRSTGS